MRCLICGRRLKNPKSIELGYGPICYQNKFGSVVRNRKDDMKLISNSSSGFEIAGQMTLDDFIQIK